MKYLDYLFYRVYGFYEKKDPSIPFLASCTFSSLIIFLTIVNIFLFIETITSEQLLYADRKWIFIVMSVILVFFILRYNKKKREKIQYNFLSETSRLRKNRGIILVIYMLVIFIVPIAIAYLRHHT